MLIHYLESLDDEAKGKALQLWAKVRGLDITDEVAKYILNRAPRDMNELFNYLNRLDDASLQQQRKITVSFVKEVLRF